MHVKVHETRSQAHSAGEERKLMRKQQVESNSQESPSHKKAKTEEEEKEAEEEDTGQKDGIRAEFEKFCKTITENLSVKQMREILEANGQYSKGDDDAVVPRR